ncbi:MAG: DUF1080 domain-containing protein [Planctomycetaceae bacterium]|nr:DUF1080 domain-containing protein [Planctomycetaceae bacterium]
MIVSHLESVKLQNRATSRRQSLFLTICCAIVLMHFGEFGFAQSVVDTRELFDGKTLKGWQGDVNHWRVEQGAIVGEIPEGQSLAKNTWLVWKGGELKDFDLRLQVKLTGAASANSGIQFRCQVKDVDHVSGYQADLDQGAKWLGRIYDEHGRALLVERGTRVSIAANGTRRVETFAPANQYAVLFRDTAWNDYRIVGVGDHVAVFVNGTLFSELLDQQKGAQDLSGGLAFQLHSGPHTRVEFRDIRLENLKADDSRLGTFKFRQPRNKPQSDNNGVVPKSGDGTALNLGFEAGSLEGWTSTGDAFKDQPVDRDGIAKRWPGQTSNKVGKFCVAGFEIVKDPGTGTLTSPTFKVTHPYASFLIGGGNQKTTRVEVVTNNDADHETLVFSAVGHRREQMRRVAVDLRKHKDAHIFIRLVDESTGAWGHLNFDDFRFHDEAPVPAESPTAWRSIKNPILQHLVPNPVNQSNDARGSRTISQMYVPTGFSVDVVAAEPAVHQPIAFTFDEKGRIWVVEGHSYPQKRPDGEGLDRVVIFSDDDGDGHFETRKVFAEGLNLVSGLEVGYGGVWIGAAPELLFIPDQDGDDCPDAAPVTLLDGFGFADTHETLNSFLWGPDGWLYGNQGVFNSSMIGKPGASSDNRTQLSAGVWRYHPTRHTFEVFAHGGSNQWGLDYDEFGQLFMTQCRSRWGKGSTTHVVQGGHYWNQVNSGYAPFVSANALPGLPAMRNYLLASARYGHGEGGAGKPGSRAVYGGHSHVGTMIYLGNNWPDKKFRNHLFTHNLHGHQINHQINRREAGGYNTLHAGQDVLFCEDQQYIGVDLKYGPDGAVYFCDWYDPRHCHSPNVEQWDRGNGRLYRMKYDATFRPTVVDYSKSSDDELVEAQLLKNDWHVRMARRVLSERHAKGNISAKAKIRLRSLALTHADPSRRLRAVWALHAVDAIDVKLAERLLEDESEYVRAWAVQLAVESLPPKMLHELLGSFVETEESLFVRRYLATAIPRVSADLGWKLLERLSLQPENSIDRELPLLTWYGLASLMPGNLDRAFKLAKKTQVPVLADYVLWYAAKLSPEGRDRIVSGFAEIEPEEQLRLLSLLELAVRGMRGLTQPRNWAEVSSRLYESSDVKTRRAAEMLGAAFGDEVLYQRMRDLLTSQTSDLAAKRHALSILTNDSSSKNLPVFLALLDEVELAQRVISTLARFDDPNVATELIARLPRWQGRNEFTAMEVLSGRVSWADQVLDGIAAGNLKKETLTAYHVRQMSNLGDTALNTRLVNEWGELQQSSSERQAEIGTLVESYKSAPIWAYSAQNGGQHFKRLCAACHQPDQQDESLGPKLAGSGTKGIEYIVENVVDPNAVIGRDYLTQIFLLLDGRLISGIVEGETKSAITIRTASESVTVSRDQIDEIKLSKNSFMPEGLLQTLNDRERIELFKFLSSQ